MTELATGAATGWIYTLALEKPELAQTLGIKSVARIRQWHLDLSMLGTATVVCALAVPDPPRVSSTALGLGAWTNAMSFLPLAFNPDVEKNYPAYRACIFGSFIATTVGFCGMANAARRRRRDSDSA